MISTLKLNSAEKKTFFLHSVYSVLKSVAEGGMLMNSFIFAKSLMATPFQVAMIIQVSFTVFILAIVFNELLKRVNKKRRFVVILTLVTHLPLLALLLFPGTKEAYQESQLYNIIYICMMAVYFMTYPFLTPVINLLLKHNYKHENYGKLFSYSLIIKKIGVIIVTFAVGILLDLDLYSFRYVIPTAAVAGIISTLILLKIPHDFENSFLREPFVIVIKKSIQRMCTILKANRNFRDFQIGFMLYGLCFTFVYTVQPIYFDKVLGLSYTENGFYISWANLITILVLPLSGKLIGKIDPRKFSVLTYILLTLYIASISMTEFYAYSVNVFGLNIRPMLLLAFTFFGLFSPMMSLQWAIGSTYYGKKSEAADYQSINISLTGLRGAIGPLLCLLVLSLSSLQAVFLIAVILLIMAIGYMHISVKQTS